jgi:peptidyl-tRNA hydrolase, PTH1 family
MRLRRPQIVVRHLIVGLGNPGPEYAHTRHNVGFMVVDELSRRHRIPVKMLKHSARIGEGEIQGEPTALAKPLTYMNISGQSVGPLLRRHSLPPSSLVVVYDDADLPLGKIRLRARGSAGGHGGLKSIIGTLGTTEFPRVRIGIGRSGRGDLVDHVLGGFRREERDTIEHAIQRAADAVEEILTDGIEPAMNRFNAAEPEGSDKE